MELKLTRLESDDFDGVFNIMKDSFPDDEIRDYDAQKALFADPVFSILAIKDKDEVKGFITVYMLETFVFAEHFAVASEYRNCGLGSKILELLRSEFDLRICLEVELPETEMAKRRISFYERNGFSFNDYEYLQPAYSNDKNPVPLRIMTTEGTISRAEFEILRKKLYKTVYKTT